MNKKILLMCVFMLFLTACGKNTSWEEEETSIEVSNRIMTDDVRVEWKLHQQASGTLVRLQISNQDEPVNDFEVNHEKLLHLIIVSKDLSYFNHVHPEYKGEGVFEIDNEFPAGGDYRMVADFQPTNGSSMSKMEWVTVDGEEAELVTVSVDNTLEKSVDGKKVTLSIDPLPEAGKEITLKFSLHDETSNEAISDLEPYLGSIGHVVVFSEDAERYLHVHAVEGQGSGPDALFETEFPTSGIYKIWGQFQKDGEVFTVPFVVSVP